jgi:DmsE family decaheme c-type cytochrome
MERVKRYLIFGAVLILIGIGASGQAEDADREASETCAVCHDTVAADLEMTVHSPNRANSPSCITCHGEGLEHMDNDGDPTLIKSGRGAEGAATCLECHGRVQTMFSNRSAHADTNVHCDSCHNVHPTETKEPFQLVRSANELCASCHPSADASFRKPFGHNLDLGGLQCVSCHNPHGGQGENSLKVDRSGEGPCVSCHAELRGPFVYPHVTGFTGTCMSCHEPHGATNPMALTRHRVDQLCLECHSVIGGDTLGSQTPSFHDLRSPRFQNCTSCHVTIHGSNASPLFLK